MAQDSNAFDADGYYGEDEINSDEIDLSFLDEDDEGKNKTN
jgi:hypothetical protein